MTRRPVKNILHFPANDIEAWFCLPLKVGEVEIDILGGAAAT